MADYSGNFVPAASLGLMTGRVERFDIRPRASQGSFLAAALGGGTSTTPGGGGTPTTTPTTPTVTVKTQGQLWPRG